MSERLRFMILVGALSLLGGVIYWARVADPPQNRDANLRTIDEGQAALDGQSSSQESHSVEINKLVEKSVHREYDALLNAAETAPNLGQPDAAALNELKDALANFSGQLIPTDIETITSSMLSKQRQDWFRRNWQESFENHAKHAPWREDALNFLKLTVDVRNDYGDIPQQEKLKLQPIGQQLLEQQCDDPVVTATLLEVFDSGMRETGELRRRLFDRFRASEYPADIAYWTAMPFMSADQLFELQHARNSFASESPFFTDDPIELRIILERVISKAHFRWKSASPAPAPNRDILTAIRASPKSHPWLRHLVLAHFGIDGSLDEWIARTENIVPLDNDQSILLENRNRSYRDRLATARMNLVLANHLLPAWKELPDNPESATLILELMQGRERQLRAGPFDSSAAFWFHQAVKGQIDYDPAYRFFLRWMREQEAFGLAHQLAAECANCQNYDTNVPARFPQLFEYGNFTIPVVGTYNFEQKRNLYSRGEAYQALMNIVEGYDTNPPPNVDLNELKSYLVCSAFYSGDQNFAVKVAHELGANSDPIIYGMFRFSLREAERETSPRSNTTNSLQLGRPIHAMQFANNGKVLICQTPAGQIYQLSLSDGTNQELFEGQMFAAFAIPGESNRIATSQGTDSVIRELDRSGVDETTLESVIIPTLDTNRAEGQLVSVKFDRANQIELELTNAKIGSSKSFTMELKEILDVSVSWSEEKVAVVGTKHDIAQPLIFTHAPETNSVVEIKNPFTHSIDGIALSKNGDIVVAWGTDLYTSQFTLVHKVVAWNASSGQVLWKDNPLFHIRELFFLDQFLVLIDDSSVIQILDAENFKQRATYFGHAAKIQAVAYSENSRLLASGDESGQVRIWDLSEGIDRHRAQGRLAEYQFKTIHNVQIDPLQGDIITQTYPEGTVRWSQKQNYEAVSAFPNGKLYWNRDGELSLVTTKLVAGDLQETLAQKTFQTEVWSPQMERRSSVSVESARRPDHHLFSDSQSLLTTGNVPIVWDLNNDEPYPWGIIRGHNGEVISFDVSINGKRLATRANPIGGKSEVSVWKMPDKLEAPDARCELLFDLKFDFAHGDIDLSNNGRYLLINHKFREIEIWDIDEKELVGKITGRRGRFSTDSKQVAIAQGLSKIIVCDTESMEQVRELKAHGAEAKHLRWCHESSKLIFSTSGWISCIDVKTGEEQIPAPR